MIIDFRGRPPTPEFKKYFHKERVTWSFIKYVGTSQLPASYTEESVERMLEEMSEAGIKNCVMTGRNVPECQIPNQHVYELEKRSGGRLIAFAGIDPSNKIHQALPELQRCVDEYGMRGVNMDPGRAPIPLKANDRRIYPVYEMCQRLGLPVILMGAVWSGPDISYTDPLAVDQVANDFPELKLVPSHGFWPFVNEVIAVAIRHKNVYICPDGYLYMPGGQAYVQAANSFLPDQIVFGTAYPYRPFKWSVDRFNEMGFSPEARDKVLYKNAQQILGAAAPAAAKK